MLGVPAGAAGGPRGAVRQYPGPASVAHRHISETPRVLLHAVTYITYPLHASTLQVITGYYMIITCNYMHVIACNYMLLHACNSL